MRSAEILAVLRDRPAGCGLTDGEIADMLNAASTNGQVSEAEVHQKLVGMLLRGQVKRTKTLGLWMWRVW